MRDNGGGTCRAEDDWSGAARCSGCCDEGGGCDGLMTKIGRREGLHVDGSERYGEAGQGDHH